MVRIEIDGKELEVPQGQMVIEAADAAGIAIPRFCYHKKLSIAANCRMCLVEVANAPKALPACATPVSEGMKIFTKSQRAQDAQKAVMEFLLINHPLDCPICDQGGECELQDVALSYGRDYSNYAEGKRSIKDKNLGPLISTEMTRCIHCTRCVRFGDEIAGVREMGATGRGEFMEIGTYIEQSVDSELSGNIIDLCPVGALTSKPFRFQARSWEMQLRPSISPHDSLGSHLYFHVLRDKVLRAQPRENEALNEVWLSDRDRFSYEAFHHEERLTMPLIKQNGAWEVVDWETALQFSIKKLDNILQKDPNQLGVLASPSSTLEEFYLLQKLMRAKGCLNLDFRLRHSDFVHEKNVSMPSLGISLPDLSQQELIILIGSDIRKEEPLVAHRVRKATLNGAKVFAINPLKADFNFEATQWVNPQGNIEQPLLALLKAVLLGKSEGSAEVAQKLSTIDPSQEAFDFAKQCEGKTKISIILGHYAITHPKAHLLYWGSRLLAQMLDATWGEMSLGANSAGGFIAGMLPFSTNQSSVGQNAKEMWENPRQAYLLFNVEPEYDCANPWAASKALKNAQSVVVFTAFDNPFTREYADVMLPIASHIETRGTYVNGLGDWQSFYPALSLKDEIKPGWKVLRVLANLWQENEFNYNSTDDIIAEIKMQQRHQKESLIDLEIHLAKPSEKDTLIRLAPTPLYAIDAIVRHAESLQQTKDSLLANEVRINSFEANKRHLKMGQQVFALQGEGRSHLPLKIKIDENIPNGAVVVASSIKQSQRLQAPFTPIELVS